MYDHSQMRILLDTCLHLNFPFPTPQPPFPSHTHTLVPSQTTLTSYFAFGPCLNIPRHCIIPSCYSSVFPNLKLEDALQSCCVTSGSHGQRPTDDSLQKGQDRNSCDEVIGVSPTGVMSLCSFIHGGMNFVTQPNNALFLHVFHLPLRRVFSLLQAFYSRPLSSKASHLVSCVC